MPKSRKPSPAPRKPRSKASAPKLKEAAYKVVMQMGDQTFVAFNDDPLEAIMSLKPDKISAKTLFTLYHDGKQSTLMRRVQWARYTLNHRTVAFHLAKNLVALLK